MNTAEAVTAGEETTVPSVRARHTSPAYAAGVGAAYLPTWVAPPRNMASGPGPGRTGAGACSSPSETIATSIGCQSARSEMILSLSGRPYGGRKEMVSVRSLLEAPQHGLRGRLAGSEGATHGAGLLFAGCLPREEQGVRERRGQSGASAQ